MLDSYARWALIALFLLSSITFVQAATTTIPYNDKRITYAPQDGSWTTWTYSAAQPCQGMWSSNGDDGKHTISLSFTGTGITVYGYSDGVAPWTFQVDNQIPEDLTVQPNSPCRVIKDSQGLTNGKHQVVVTLSNIHFVLTKFVVTGSVSGTNLTYHSPAVSLKDGGNLAHVLFFVLPVYFFIALL